MEKFIAHGYHACSNSMGYEVQISDCGDAARLKYLLDDETQVSDWLPIEHKYLQDDEDDFPVAIIDPEGYNIPLNQVMRLV